MIKCHWQDRPKILFTSNTYYILFSVIVQWTYHFTQNMIILYKYFIFMETIIHWKWQYYVLIHIVYFWGEHLAVHRYNMTARYIFSIKYNTYLNHNTVLKMLFKDTVPKRQLSCKEVLCTSSYLIWLKYFLLFSVEIN